jgi:hypothetical protein
VIVIIWGTFWQSDPVGPTLQRPPGTCVPSSEQKQSGSLQMLVSQAGARLGSVSISAESKKMFKEMKTNLSCVLPIKIVQLIYWFYPLMM